MARQRREVQFRLARILAFPLWLAAIRSRSALDILADVNWWIECLDDENLAAQDTPTRFAYFTAALPEFRTLVHYRLRTGSPRPVRLLMRALYHGQDGLLLEPDSLGPGCFIQHGVATLVAAKSIGSHFWLNQQVTIGFIERGMPTIGDHVTVGVGALVLGDITLHDGAVVGAGAVVLDDVGPGEVMIGQKATVLKRRPPVGAAPGEEPTAVPEQPEQ